MEDTPSRAVQFGRFTVDDWLYILHNKACVDQSSVLMFGSKSHDEWIELIDELTKQECRFDESRTPEQPAEPSNRPAHHATEKSTFNETLEYESSSAIPLCSRKHYLPDVHPTSMTPKTLAQAVQLGRFAVEEWLEILYNRACADYPALLKFGSKCYCEWIELIDMLARREGIFDGSRTPEQPAEPSNRTAHVVTQMTMPSKALEYDSSPEIALCSEKHVLSEVATTSMTV